MYSCDLCNRTFSKKYNLQRHIATKPNCKKDLSQCQFCDKIFYDTSNRIRHENKACSENNLIKKYKLLEEKVHELETMLKNGVNPLSVVEHNNSHNTTNNNNNNINNITNNIVINKYGFEDISHITKRQIIAILRKCFLCVPAFIKLKHFNTKTPHNCNVYIADIKSRYALIFNGIKWTITDKDELLNELYSENCNFLECEFTEKIDELDQHTITTFKRFLDKKDDDEISKMVKENIRQLLYNEKDVPLTVKNSNTE